MEGGKFSLRETPQTAIVDRAGWVRYRTPGRGGGKIRPVNSHLDTTRDLRETTRPFRMEVNLISLNES